MLGALWLLRVIFKPLGLSHLYHTFLIHLVKKTQLFDRDYYLDTNSDVAEGKILPLRHYVSYGDREGRAPMAFFDPTYYRTHAKRHTAQVNALLHYAYVGRYRAISPSPWIDVAYYLANNKDVARTGQDPLLHYLKWGGLEGRAPSPQFDSAYYLNINPDVAEARVNPLLHYLQIGRKEGRCTLRQDEGADESLTELGEITQPSVPTAASWSGLIPRAGVDGALVDVVVPVYKGRAETLRCLHSVLTATCNVPFELIVINDASPDNTLVEDLQRIADKGLITLLANPENRGFVHTVNRGMSLNHERDVVLLNSDAEVYDYWLERLHSAAYRNERTGTVTPLSNNATICSYPRFLHDNPFPLEIDYAKLDKLTAQVNHGVEVETPTGVGFCMYIKRKCLNNVGLFDEKAFGKGYGEENDFCQRAIRKGWRNIIAADVFAHHWGSASFQGEKAKRVQAALKVMAKRHPRYHQDVDEFIKRDPLAVARRRLDWARMRRMRRQNNVLIVCHNRGGGTERHVQEDIKRLSAEGFGVYLLRPAHRRPSYATLTHPAINALPNIPAFALSETEALKDALKDLDIREIHTHSFVDFETKAPIHLIAVIKELKARWEVNLHDYKVICPRINLADENGYYCGEPNYQECNNCLAERGSDFAVTDICTWRGMHSVVLMTADQVLVPDDDVEMRLQRYFPQIQFSVSPHETIDSLNIAAQRLWPQPGEALRVVVVGAIGKLKGFDVLLNCARDARLRRLAIQFIVMGYSMNDRLLEEVGVHVTGKYSEAEAVELLSSLKPHLVWLPSLWPETYSYTLSLALQAGYPVMAFDIGAIATRLRKLHRDELLIPLEYSNQPKRLNDILLEYVSGLDSTECSAVS